MVEWASALSFVGFGSVIFLETFLEGDDSFLATFIMAPVADRSCDPSQEADWYVLHGEEGIKWPQGVDKVS